MGSFSIGHLVLLVVIVLIIFGAGKLPKVMADLGKGLKSFKDGAQGEEMPAATPVVESGTVVALPEPSQKKPAKKAAPKKVAVKKETVKKEPVKKEAVKKATPKKVAPKKAAVKKAAPKKPAAPKK